MLINNQYDQNTFTSLRFVPQKIDNKLLRGQAISNPIELYKLKKMGVNQVIDLRVHFLSRFFEVLMCKVFGIKYQNIKYSHTKSIFPSDNFFEHINDLILKNDGKTYIHCRHGKRRTGVCVAIYEKNHTDKTTKEILSEFHNIGFKDLILNSKKMSTKKYNKLVKIYNDFIEKFYPQEKKLDCKI